ncbi:MAG TPA: hypothetical protein VG537_07945, partial [Candidatus Kapabacteria bacterium]|nr:hypothetical protein [Candidatus Kapabacteria bacterium]
MRIRHLILLVILFIPIQFVRAQTVTVTDLMPLNLGQYVEYNEYDTASSGSAPAKSRASYSVFGTGLNFQGASGVARVRDSSAISGNSATITDLHYLATGSGDIQIFADSTILTLVVPPSLLAGAKINAPNQFVDYLKTSGVSNTYAITTVTGSTTYQGIPINVSVTFTGTYRGME